MNSDRELKTFNKSLVKLLLFKSLQNLGAREYKMFTVPLQDTFKDIDLGISTLQYSKIKFNYDAIMKIIACMPCEKCQLWSSVQFTGLRCALRLLSNEKVCKYDVQCLINTVGRIVNSESKYEKLSKKTETFSFFLYYYRYVGLLYLTCIFLCCGYYLK